MTAPVCTELPAEESSWFTEDDIPVATLGEGFVDKGWPTENTEAPAPDSITQYEEPVRPPRSAFRPRLTGLDEEDAVLDSPNSLAPRIAALKARGFVLRSDPRRRP